MKKNTIRPVAEQFLRESIKRKVILKLKLFTEKVFGFLFEETNATKKHLQPAKEANLKKRKAEPLLSSPLLFLIFFIELVIINN
jgi:hypothetical protein